MSYWASRPYVGDAVRDAVQRADVLAVPTEGFRDHDGPVFPVGMEELLPFVRSHVSPGFHVEICIDDDLYNELALHSFVLQLGNWLVTTLAAPLFVNALWEYIKQRKRRTLAETSVRVRMLLQRAPSDGVVIVDYDGPAETFADSITEAMERALRSGAPDKALEGPRAPDVRSGDEDGTPDTALESPRASDARTGDEDGVER